MTLRYGSVCSGIEAATQAWHVMGWRPAFFSEIEQFPSAVLAHHYPDIPNHGDMNRYKEWPDHAIDLLVGGTPCQSFSVAGLRGGLDDARGNLMLVYAAIARRYRPKWVVWENVPGVLSSDEGRDFASLLGLLSGRRVTAPSDGWRNSGIVEGYEGAYGLAWRVLDAQYVRVDGYPDAVPQRRRRVFVVGHSGGDWRRAAAVLLEFEGMRGNPPPRRQSRKGAASFAASSLGNYSESSVGGTLRSERNGDENLVDAWPADVASTLNAAFGDKQGLEDQHALGGASLFVPGEVSATVTSKWAKGSGGFSGDEAGNLVVAPTAAPLMAHDGQIRNEEAFGNLVAFGKAVNTTGHQGDVIVGHGDAHPALSAQGGNNGGGPGALVCYSIHADAISHDPEYIKGKSNAGMGVIGDGSAYTMVATKPHAVAYPPARPASVGFAPMAMPYIASRPEAIAFDMRGREGGAQMEGPHDTANIWAASGGSSKSYVAMPEVASTIGANEGRKYTDEGSMMQLHNVVPANWAVRRLTPMECERLQGFPDNFTLVPYRGKQAPDGPRYKALGNSMACNVMRWIGRRIEALEAIP